MFGLSGINVISSSYNTLQMQCRLFAETIEAGRPLDSLQMQMLYQPNAVKANESNGV